MTHTHSHGWFTFIFPLITAVIMFLLTLSPAQASVISSDPVIIDNSSTDFTAVGAWPASTAVFGYNGLDYRTHAAGVGASSATWSVNVAEEGVYEVFAWWTAYPNRATNAKFSIDDDVWPTTKEVNQRTNGSRWVSLGTYRFSPGYPYQVILSDDADGYVIADAIKVQKVDYTVIDNDGASFVAYGPWGKSTAISITV